MICLIDYKGFRLIAMPVLPIGNDTIKYGSDDGGRTVHTDLPELNDVMKRVGERLNVKGHYVGLHEQHFIYGAGDVEVHQGYDGSVCLCVELNVSHQHFQVVSTF